MYFSNSLLETGITLVQAITSLDFWLFIVGEEINLSRQVVLVRLPLSPLKYNLVRNNKAKGIENSH